MQGPVVATTKWYVTICSILERHDFLDTFVPNSKKSWFLCENENPTIVWLELLRLFFYRKLQKYRIIMIGVVPIAIFHLYIGFNDLLDDNL